MKVETDQGIVGWGEAICGPIAVATLVEEFGQELIGEDPARIEDHWQRLSDYTVQPGDSLAAIAELFLTSPGAIVLLNNIAADVAPEPGLALVIPWGFTLDVG